MLFLEGVTASEAQEKIEKKPPMNHVSIKTLSEVFNIMRELSNLDRELNWTEEMALANKYSISSERVRLLARAMFHAGWKPSCMGRRIVEKLRIPETNHKSP